MKRNILLLGSYGRGNAGDDAFLVAALKLFEKFNITINSHDDSVLPHEARDRVQTINTGQLKGLRRKLKAFLRSDYVIYGGGDLWVELYGSRMPRKSLWMMVCVNLVAKIFRKRVIYLGCGAGNIKGLSRLLAHLSIKLADTTIVRDSNTAKLLNLSDEAIFPDLTINLFSTKLEPKEQKDKTRITVAISGLYFIPQPSKNFPLFISQLEKFCRTLDTEKYRLVFIPMFTSRTEAKDDQWVGQTLQERLGPDRLDILSYSTVNELLDIIADVDMIVGARLHSNILAVWSGVPALGISYRPKVARFFAENELEKFCIDIKEIERLGPLFYKMGENIHETRQFFIDARSRNIAQKKKYEEFIQNLEARLVPDGL